MKEKLVLFLSVGILTWVSIGTPMHTIDTLEHKNNTKKSMVAFESLQENKDIPTFDPDKFVDHMSRYEQENEHKYVIKTRSLIEDLAYDPCDKKIKKELKKSFKPFYRAVYSFLIFRNLTDEQILYFEPLGNLLEGAASSGLIMRKDMPFILGFFLKHEVDFQFSSACLDNRLKKQHDKP